MADFKLIAEALQNWSDGISLFLLLVAFFILGLSPKRSVWFQWHKVILQAVVLSVLIVWNVFRFVVEGVFDAVGPREAYAVTFAYVSRWIWLLLERVRSRKCRRWLEVIRELRNLPRVDARESGSQKRKGEQEVVVKIPIQFVPKRYKTKKRRYWRGYETSVKPIEYGYIDEESGNLRIGVRWLVHIVDENLHLQRLEGLLNDRKWDSKEDIEILCSEVHDFIWRCFPDAIDDLQDLNWCKKFTDRWAFWPSRYRSESKRINSLCLRSKISRRVKLDACNYIFANADYFLKEQVKVLREILEETAIQLCKNLPPVKETLHM